MRATLPFRHTIAREISCKSCPLIGQRRGLALSAQQGESTRPDNDCFPIVALGAAWSQRSLPKHRARVGGASPHVKPGLEWSMQTRNSSDPHPVVQIGIGVFIGLVAFGAAWACTGSRQLSPDAACRLRALEVLPEDLGQVTVYDAIDIYERVRACARALTDGGP